LLMAGGGARGPNADLSAVDRRSEGMEQEQDSREERRVHVAERGRAEAGENAGAAPDARRIATEQ
jgi:hypothetical protein